jgi:hypothetical protein
MAILLAYGKEIVTSPGTSTQHPTPPANDGALPHVISDMAAEWLKENGEALSLRGLTN